MGIKYKALLNRPVFASWYLWFYLLLRQADILQLIVSLQITITETLTQSLYISVIRSKSVNYAVMIKLKSISEYEHRNCYLGVSGKEKILLHT